MWRFSEFKNKWITLKFWICFGHTFWIDKPVDRQLWATMVTKASQWSSSVCGKIFLECFCYLKIVWKFQITLAENATARSGRFSLPWADRPCSGCGWLQETIWDQELIRGKSKFESQRDTIKLKNKQKELFLNIFSIFIISVMHMHTHFNLPVIFLIPLIYWRGLILEFSNSGFW